MIATTPTPPCAPISVGTSSTLLSISSIVSTSYGCYAYEWTSPTTGLVTLAFQLRHDPSYWYLDDVLVYDGGTEMLSNTGFETGLISPWLVTSPYGTCGSFPGTRCGSSCYTGTSCFCDGSFGCADQISQQFSAVAGQVYVVSFWLRSGGTGSVISALVTLS